MEKFTYLFLILIWSLPLVLLQWLIGADVLLKHWKVLIPGIIVPTLYLTIADSLPLASHTWTINPTQSLGIFVPIIHVPLEEGVFFLVTNALVVQGLIFLMNFPFMVRRMRRLIVLGKRRPQFFRTSSRPE